MNDFERQLNFNRQIKKSIRNAVEEFNSNSNYINLRKLYKSHFEEIASLIQRLGPKLAIEDISYIDIELSKGIGGHILLFQEINRGIDYKEILIEDIED